MVDAISKSIQTIQGFIDKIQEAINKANSIPVVGSFIPDSLTTKKTSTTNINLTVKGGVPDKVATARTMTQLLNQTQKTTGLRAFA